MLGWMLEVVFLWNPFFAMVKIKQNWNLCLIAWWSKEKRRRRKMLSMRQTKPMTMMNQNGRNRRNKCVSHFVYGNAPPTVRCRFFGSSTHGNIIFFFAHSTKQNACENDVDEKVLQIRKRTIWRYVHCAECFCFEWKKKTFSKLDNLQMYRTTRAAQQLHETEKKYKSTYACSSYSCGIQCFACWMMLQ